MPFEAKPSAKMIRKKVRQSKKKKREKPEKEIAERLIELGLKIVFAESCTGGLVAATLANIPGISEVLCGSAVVYRTETKKQWLGISLEQNPVSRKVAEEMAISILKKTPEADLSASITGHLGPNAPKSLDGVAFIAVAMRMSKDLVKIRPRVPTQDKLKTNKRAPIRVKTLRIKLPKVTRVKRQKLASQDLLLVVRSLLGSTT